MTEQTQGQEGQQDQQQTTQPAETQETKTTQEQAGTGEAEEKTLLGEETESNVQAPEKYEFKIPEGMELDTELVEAVTPLFREANISQEQAQKIVDAYVPYLTKVTEKQQNEAIDFWKKQVEGWKDQTTKMLGVNLKTELATAAKFINKYGSPELRQVLEETGLGNHPEIIKAFIKAGKAISDDTFVDPGKTKKETEGVDLNKLYPSMST